MEKNNDTLTKLAENINIMDDERKSYLLGVATGLTMNPKVQKKKKKTQTGRNA